MIAAASEVERGVDNLWKSGRSGGRTVYPDFGQYMSKNEFKCFSATAPLCWAEKKHWFGSPRDQPWDVFLPCLQSMNTRRRELMNVELLLLDESMIGWCPKTSCLGGLPIYTYEPRKPVSLGTMLRNGACGMMGALVSMTWFR